jgi:hypothetical protein
MRFPQRFPIISPPFTAGSAPTCGGALALRYGSDLLPLRLLSHCRSGDARAPPDHGAFGLCHAPGTPRRRTVLSRDRASWTRSPSGGGPPANDPCGDWLVSSNQYPLGNCIWSPGRNLPAPMTRLSRGFSSRLAAHVSRSHQPPCATTAAETGEICLAGLPSPFDPQGVGPASGNQPLLGHPSLS